VAGDENLRFTFIAGTRTLKEKKAKKGKTLFWGKLSVESRLLKLPCVF